MFLSYSIMELLTEEEVLNSNTTKINGYAFASVQKGCQNYEFFS